MEENKHLDFATSLVLFALAAYIIAEGVKWSIGFDGVFYGSPGVFPCILGFLLMLCSVKLFLDSIKSVGFKTNTSNLSQWFKSFVKSELVINTIIGIVILFIYTFILLSIFPFWLASIVLLVFLMMYLNATSIIKVLIISGLSVTGIVVLFEVLFRVPLP